MRSNHEVGDDLYYPHNVPIAVIFVTCEPIRFAGVNEPYITDSG